VQRVIECLGVCHIMLCYTQVLPSTRSQLFVVCCLLSVCPLSAVCVPVCSQPQAGSPSETDLSCLDNDAAIAIVRSHDGLPKFSLPSVFFGTDPEALDLLTKLLVFHPGRRLTAQQALEHPFLDELHSRGASFLETTSPTMSVVPQCGWL
jgi:hypothetical protein